MSPEKIERRTRIVQKQLDHSGSHSLVPLENQLLPAQPKVWSGERQKWAAPEVVVNLVGDLLLAHVEPAAGRQKRHLSTNGWNLHWRGSFVSPVLYPCWKQLNWDFRTYSSCKIGHFRAFQSSLLHQPSIWPPHLLDKILSSELWGCFALAHVPLQLKCLVQGEDDLKQKVQICTSHVTMKAEWKQYQEMRNLAIGEPVERLTLLLHSLYGTNLRENLSLWNSFTTKPSSWALLPSAPGRGRGQGSLCLRCLPWSAHSPLI